MKGEVLGTVASGHPTTGLGNGIRAELFAGYACFKANITDYWKIFLGDDSYLRMSLTDATKFIKSLFTLYSLKLTAKGKEYGLG